VYSVIVVVVVVISLLVIALMFIDTYVWLLRIVHVVCSSQVDTGWPGWVYL